MANTVNYQVTKCIGYSGKNAAKTWIASITGIDAQYGFCREFCETKCADDEQRDEMLRARRKGKGSWIETADVCVGLYEIATADGRSYRVVYVKDGEVVSMKTDIDRVTAMAKLMTAGESFEAARLATRKPATKAS